MTGNDRAWTPPGMGRYARPLVIDSPCDESSRRGRQGPNGSGRVSRGCEWNAFWKLCGRRVVYVCYVCGLQPVSLLSASDNSSTTALPHGNLACCHAIEGSFSCPSGGSCLVRCLCRRAPELRLQQDLNCNQKYLSTSFKAPSRSTQKKACRWEGVFLIMEKAWFRVVVLDSDRFHSVASANRGRELHLGRACFDNSLQGCQ